MNPFILLAVKIKDYKVPGLTYLLLKRLANMIVDIAGPGLVSDVKNALLGTWDSNAEMADSIYNFANVVFDTVKYVGCFLLMVHFLCDIMEKVTNERFTLESFFKSLVKFFIGFALILNCLTIFKTLTQFGNVIADEIGKNVQNVNASGGSITYTYNGTEKTISQDELSNLTDEERDAVMSSYSDSFLDIVIEELSEDVALKSLPNTLLKKIGAMIYNFQITLIGPFRVLMHMCTLLVPWLFAKLTYFVCMIIAFTRCLELLVRAAIAPMAITDIYSQGTHGNGFRFIKKFFAIALQGAIIILLVTAMGQAAGFDFTTSDSVHKLASSILGNGTSGTGALWKTVFFRIAGTGLVLKSQSVASEVVGA